ncbi:MAG: hypothetical protein QNJ38_24655 [Prochloraceae cyanobacterium]|nr:hypothetical protein [Prochloraceae cyanobacterium]
MNFILNFFIVLTTIALSLSVIVHLLSFFKKNDLLNKIAGILQNSIFLVWLPAGIVAYKIVPAVSTTQLWQQVLSGSPDWTIKALLFLGIYVFISLMVVISKSFISEIDSSKEQVFKINFQTLSSISILAYSVALAIFYSALQVLNNHN